MERPLQREVGDTLNGQYKLIEKLGEGGFGKVMKAEDLNKNDIVAVKIPLAAILGSASLVHAFDTEAIRMY